jgi:hypothetical protein
MENHKSCDDFLGEQDIGVVIIDEQHTNRLQQIIQAHGDPLGCHRTRDVGRLQKQLLAEPERNDLGQHVIPGGERVAGVGAVGFDRLPLGVQQIEVPGGAMAHPLVLATLTHHHKVSVLLQRGDLLRGEMLAEQSIRPRFNEQPVLRTLDLPLPSLLLA